MVSLFFPCNSHGASLGVYISHSIVLGVVLIAWTITVDHVSILPLIMCMLLTVVTTHFDSAAALKLAGKLI